VKAEHQDCLTSYTEQMLRGSHFGMTFAPTSKGQRLLTIWMHSKPSNFIDHRAFDFAAKVCGMSSGEDSGSRFRVARARTAPSSESWISIGSEAQLIFHVFGQLLDGVDFVDCVHRQRVFAGLLQITFQIGGHLEELLAVSTDLLLAFRIG